MSPSIGKKTFDKPKCHGSKEIDKLQSYKSKWLGPNGYRIGTETCYIPKVRKFYEEKGYLC